MPPKPKKPKLTLVLTPKAPDFQCGNMTLHDVGSHLTSEMRTYQKWTDQCSTVMRRNLKLLYRYDRSEFLFGNAYGNHHIKLVLNPMMIICPHFRCLKGNPLVRLGHPFCLKKYLIHLESHQDKMGDALRLRFGAIHQNPFIGPAALDEISISPHHLQTFTEGTDIIHKIMETYGIERNLPVNYICHWKDLIIQHGLITSESLTFQEDEALVASILNYPNPVEDWTVWNTLYLYGLKFMTSVSNAGLNLYRGITSYPRLNDSSSSNGVETFVSNINHPTASLTTFQRDLPDLNYSNKVCHGGEIIYHIKCIQKSKDRLILEYENGNVVRIPITLGCDEQEINPGTAIQDGLLHGLMKKMTAQEIEEIGLDNLAQYIAEKNKFITGVRESRATDFRDQVCSNVVTEFVTHELNGDECRQQLKDAMAFANSCYRCLKLIANISKLINAVQIVLIINIAV